MSCSYAVYVLKLRTANMGRKINICAVILLTLPFEFYVPSLLILYTLVAFGFNKACSVFFERRCANRNVASPPANTSRIHDYTI